MQVVQARDKLTKHTEQWEATTATTPWGVTYLLAVVAAAVLLLSLQLQILMTVRDIFCFLKPLLFYGESHNPFDQMNEE